jgi:glutamyl-tRNA synthetase
MARERLPTLVRYAADFRYFYEKPAFDEKAKAKFLTADAKPMLQELRDGVAGLPALDAEPLEKLFKDAAEKRGLGLGKVAQPARVALTGGTASPGMYDVIQILGREETLARLDAAIAGIPG